MEKGLVSIRFFGSRFCVGCYDVYIVIVDGLKGGGVASFESFQYTPKYSNW
jgi:hypothetical protein